MSKDTGSFPNSEKSAEMETAAENVMAEDVAAAQAAAEGNDGAAEVNEAQRLNEELQAANERALRAQAELENFRKRMRREAEEERRYAAVPLIVELLPVIDNLERAIASSENITAAAEVVTGVKMVHSQFLTALERSNCRRIGEAGEAFDPHQHQAIAQEPSTEFPAGTVTRVTRYGYRLHDRVIRPAEVVVSSGTGNSSAAPGT